MRNNNLQIIALYLPQFYPIKENDQWWGPGFTEWINVARAKPLFKGHNQPRIPADLSFYDLRVPEVREQQVQLAKEAGITAFCYWHYWFGNGKRLLQRVFDEVLKSGNPDFPFCLGWANHSWYAKTWNKEAKDKLLIEQTYPGIEDAEAHFNFLLEAFNDSRYVKVDGRPFLLIFDPGNLPSDYITYFNTRAKEAGFSGLYLVAYIQPQEDKEYYIKRGYSSVLYNRIMHQSKLRTSAKSFINLVHAGDLGNIIIERLARIKRMYRKLFCRLKPFIFDYEVNYKQLVTQNEYEEDVIPQLVPQWDHTPRSGVNGTVWVRATPNNFYLHAIDALKAVKAKKNKLIILKSWNEWGEGNYMEPDTKYGHGFIKALRKAIEQSS